MKFPPEGQAQVHNPAVPPMVPSLMQKKFPLVPSSAVVVVAMHASAVSQLVPESSTRLPAMHTSHVVGEPSTMFLNSPEEHVVQDEAPWLLKLGSSQGGQSSEAPVEKVLEGHTSKPVLSALAFVPAPFVEQNAAPAESENSPGPLQGEQTEPSPLSPAMHTSHVVGDPSTMFLNSPEEHVVQDEAPWLLKLGLGQSVQSSEAPVEKVLKGHSSAPVLLALTFVPAPFVEQNAAPEEE